MSSETGGSGDTEQGGAGEVTPPVQTSEAAVQAPEVEVPAQAGPPQGEGRRTQLRIIREDLHSLSKDVGSFRNSQEARVKRLEKEVASLRGDLAALKGHSLRNELIALKGHVTKEVARGRKKQEATLSRILAKVSAKPKPSKPKTSKPARHSKK